MTIRNIKKQIVTAMAISCLFYLFSIATNYWSSSSVVASVAQSRSNNDASSTSCQNSSELPWLNVNGKWVEDEAGNKVTLRGMSFVVLTTPGAKKSYPTLPRKSPK